MQSQEAAQGLSDTVTHLVNQHEIRAAAGCMQILYQRMRCAGHLLWVLPADDKLPSTSCLGS